MEAERLRNYEAGSPQSELDKIQLLYTSLRLSAMAQSTLKEGDPDDENSGIGPWQIQDCGL